jgi:hypothetical protein
MKVSTQPGRNRPSRHNPIKTAFFRNKIMARGTATTTAIIQAMKDAAEPLPKCPAHVNLRAKDLPFYEGIVRARPRSEWIANDLVVAAQLARCQASIEEETEKLEGEGSVITNFRGSPVMNPRHSILEGLARREMALMRTLRLGGLPPKMADTANARLLQRQAEAAREDVLDDELLAK